MKQTFLLAIDCRSGSVRRYHRVQVAPGVYQVRRAGEARLDGVDDTTLDDLNEFRAKG